MKHLGLAAAVALAVAGSNGMAAAALPPADTMAALPQSPADPAHFAIMAPLLAPASEAVPDDGNDAPEEQGPDGPIAFWLFGMAALILPASAVGAGVARRLPRSR